MITLRSWPDRLRAALLLAAAIAVLAPLADESQAHDGPRQMASLTYTSSKPSSPSGIRFVVDWANPNDPNARPVPVQRIVTRGPRGARFDTTAVPRCGASDAELLGEGATACPVATRVGAGTVISDTGPSGPFPRYSSNTASIFNNRDEQINFAETDSPPPIRAVSRTALRRHKTTAEVPTFPPGVPPSQSLTSLKRLNLTFPRLVRRGKAYFRTPRFCPRSREWTNRITFVYADGVRQQVVATTPCRPS
jgi:hypothetical protein